MSLNVEQTIRNYISKVVHLSLASVSGDAPWVCEVHFAYDNELNLYFRSLTSRRHSQDIAVNPKVAGDIIVQHSLTEAPRGVYFECAARKLETNELQAAYDFLKNASIFLSRLLRKLSRVMVISSTRLRWLNITFFNARETKPSKKYELEWNAH